jgi:hypothetical protein
LFVRHRLRRGLHRDEEQGETGASSRWNIAKQSTHSRSPTAHAANRTQRQNEIAHSASAAKDEKYTHDGLYRLLRYCRPVYTVWVPTSFVGWNG